MQQVPYILKLDSGMDVICTVDESTDLELFDAATISIHRPRVISYQPAQNGSLQIGLFRFFLALPRELESLSLRTDSIVAYTALDDSDKELLDVYMKETSPIALASNMPIIAPKGSFRRM